jgi:glycosyltransferase involved in cell wall biosynthesis
MRSLPERPLKVVLVAPMIARYDAISATVYDTYRVLSAERDINVTALTWRNDFSDVDSRIVGDVSDLLLYKDFLAADVLLYNFGIYSALFDAMLVGNGRARQIVQFHNITPPGLVNRRDQHIIERSWCQLANLKCVDEIWAVSAVNAEELTSRGFDPGKLRVVPLAVESPPLALLGEKQAAVVELLFVGRIVPSKGVLDLVRAIRKTRERTAIPFRLRIVGNREWSDQAYLAQVESEIVDGRLSGIVEILGTVESAVLESLYHAAHIFVIPSYHEGFCKPVVEALRAGCVPIGYASYNLPYIVNGLGRMVPPGNIELLAAALVEVIEGIVRCLRGAEISLHLDVGLLSVAAFDMASKAYVTGFSLSRFGRAVVARIRQICDHPCGLPDPHNDQEIQDATGLSPEIFSGRHNNHKL